MQKIFLLIGMFIISNEINAQIKRIYGYVQEINGGAMQENNQPVRYPQISLDNRRYFVFAELAMGKPASFEQLWINGNLYSFKTETVRKMPIIIQSRSGEMISRDTLLKGARPVVIQLLDLVLVPQKKRIIPRNIRTLITKNEIVIVSKTRNKSYYTSLHRTVKLFPLFTE